MVDCVCKINIHDSVDSITKYLEIVFSNNMPNFYKSYLIFIKDTHSASKYLIPMLDLTIKYLQFGEDLPIVSKDHFKKNFEKLPICRGHGRITKLRSQFKTIKYYSCMCYIKTIGIINDKNKFIMNYKNNMDMFNFALGEPYNIHPKRLPLVTKYFNNIDFNLIDDHIMFIHKELIKMKLCEECIHKKIIDNFPLMNENVTFNIYDLNYVCVSKYHIPPTKLKILIDKLNKYNFLDCDDIHLKIHNIVLKFKNNLTQVTIECIDVNLSDIYDNLDETMKVKIFNSKKDNTYIHDNHIQTSIHTFKYKNEIIPIFQKINYDLNICILCDCRKVMRPMIMIKDNFTIDKIYFNNIHICDDICTTIILNSDLTIGNFKCRSKWRHFKKKLMLVKCLDMDIDIINYIIQTYMKMVL